MLLPKDFVVYRHPPHPPDFLVVFSTPDVAQRVLQTVLPPDAPFLLVWKQWCRQLTARSEPLRFRVLVELKGIPTHARNICTAQTILGSVGSDLVEAPASLVGNDRRVLFVASWCVHPNLVPAVKLVFITDPLRPFEPGNLFLRPHEIIHSKHDGLWYKVFPRIVQYQDWNNPSDSSDDDTPPDRLNSSDDEDYPGHGMGEGRGLGPNVLVSMKMEIILLLVPTVVHP